jgi:hypothetical protein
VYVGLDEAAAMKQSGKDKGVIATTNVIQFPIRQFTGDLGYRVGQVWSHPVPNTVKQTARSLLRRMMISAHNVEHHKKVGGK